MGDELGKARHKVEQERGACTRQGGNEDRPLDGDGLKTVGKKPIFELGEGLLQLNPGKSQPVNEPIQSRIVAAEAVIHLRTTQSTMTTASAVTIIHGER